MTVDRPSIASVRRYHYDPETGVITKPNGKPMGTSRNGCGYINGAIYCGRTYSIAQHIIAWAWMTGTWPEETDQFIDHINGERDDNRWGNLRLVTRQEQNQNLALSKRNNSGQVGVCWYKRKQQWHVRIGHNHIGYFNDFNAAVAARKAAERQYGFHANHGRMAQ